jgi:hypothetical protein
MESMASMVEGTEEEYKHFHERYVYADELKKKKQDSRRDIELEIERNEIKQQGMKTPERRRGAQIKHEEK